MVRHSHIGIFVRELEPAVRFYAALAGVEVVHVMEIPEYGLRNAFVMTGPDVYIELIEAPPSGKVRVLGEDHLPGQQMMALETPDLAGAVARARAAGAQVHEMPRTSTLPFARAWIARASRGDLPIELVPEGTVSRLVTQSEVWKVSDLG